jgi:hypothetical protein
MVNFIKFFPQKIVRKNAVFISSNTIKTVFLNLSNLARSWGTFSCTACANTLQYLT